MKIEQDIWSKETGWKNNLESVLGKSADLVLLFGSTEIFSRENYAEEIRRVYPDASFIGCTTAGEIYGNNVSDDTLVITAINFEYSQIKGAQVRFSDFKNSYSVGEHLAKELDASGLVHLFVLSKGLDVNGSALVRGLTAQLPESVAITGGLAGDGGRFKKTLVLWDDDTHEDSVAVLGLYGDRLKVGYGSVGGWDTFGPERLITRSEENVLYELDGTSALSLYKKYLGEHAEGLPATGLLYPLSLRMGENDDGVVRTILAIDEKEGSLTFAGDVPEGTYARLMKVNFDRLIDGAIGAAKLSNNSLKDSTPEIAILISCVGRKMVLQQRVEEEVEGVQDILGKDTILTGFYSYGEISPFMKGVKCELHNQTMTITTLSEN